MNDIRLLDRTDAEAYRAMMLEAYESHPRAFTSTVAERAALPMTWWQERVAGGASEVLGAFEAGSLVGAVGLKRETREKARHRATLFAMYVKESQRGKGLGRGLVEALKRRAMEYPELRVVDLTVTEGNEAAEKVYLRCGFIPFGLEPMAMEIAGEYVAKLHMWYRLKAVSAAGQNRLQI